MKLVIAATGASGTIYLQRLLDQIDAEANEVHLIMSGHAKQVAAQETDELKIPAGRRKASRERSECSVRQRLGALRRHGDCALFDVHARADRQRLRRNRASSHRRCFLEGASQADRGPARDTLEPDSRAQRRDSARSRRRRAARRSRPTTAVRNPSTDVVDTVVWRILDQIGLPNPRAYRWKDDNQPVARPPQ